MFVITRMAANLTKLERNIVKNVAKLPYEAKIFTNDASENAQKLLGEEFKILPYSKNIFKRAATWVKTFVARYKMIKKEMKTSLDKFKENYGELFTKKRKKKVINLFSKGIKEFSKDIKKEFNEFKEQLVKEQ